MAGNAKKCENNIKSKCDVFVFFSLLITYTVFFKINIC